MEISEKTIRFIQEHAKDDVNALRLKYLGKSSECDFPIEFAILQIEARRKARKKLPSFLNNPYFIFPDALAAEQASNEIVAGYHASLIPSDGSLLDLTAGLGIDSLSFAAKGINVTACEIDCNKSKALEHNAKLLGLDRHLNVQNADSIEYVRKCDLSFDTVFADPARRGDTGKRLHALSDCQPDILKEMTSIMNLTDRLLVKSSPLLDLTFIRDTVENLSHIYVVCVRGECKEVLIEIAKDRNFSGTTVVDLDNEGIISRFECHHSPIGSDRNIRYADHETPAEYRYLYEPNSGVMKTGAWEELIQRFPELCKVDSNTHLFCSDTLYTEFPGRIVEITGQLDKKALKGLNRTKWNVVARNYPLSAVEFAKKNSLIPGGDRFIYAFRYKGKPVCVAAENVSRDQQVQE